MSLRMLWVMPGYCGKVGSVGGGGGYKCWGTPSPPHPRAHLDLHGHLSAVLQHPKVHLPNGGGGKRCLLESQCFLPPARAQLLCQHLL